MSDDTCQCCLAPLCEPCCREPHDPQRFPQFLSTRAVVLPVGSKASFGRACCLESLHFSAQAAPCVAAPNSQHGWEQVFVVGSMAQCFLNRIAVKSQLVVLVYSSHAFVVDTNQLGARNFKRDAIPLTLSLNNNPSRAASRCHEVDDL
ncbi:hypothetical protein, variant [Phytophthora nicotianae P1976]|uniref:Uncharacterized protein n=1 Tax=Phytophthora nicotianae P1976 TaxID=1317066 RepID=A0A080YVK9_PHYNI|nr:hypothetical protein F444_23203 [Phytophthora nicotianae P1976]ETO58421.1 hypothetical protein, variant [Phytophthora nicotianae P1976]